MVAILTIIAFLVAAVKYAKADYDDWKAPPPPPAASLKDEPKRYPAHHALVNEVVEQEGLPYIHIQGYDLKIAINSAVLAQYNLRSGDSVPAELMYKIIDADRQFQKGVLR